MQQCEPKNNQEDGTDEMDFVLNYVRLCYKGMNFDKLLNKYNNLK